MTSTVKNVIDRHVYEMDIIFGERDHIFNKNFLFSSSYAYITIESLSNDGDAEDDALYILQAKFTNVSGSARYANGSENVFKLNMQRRRLIPNGNTKISRRLPCSEDDAELGDFTLLFCRGRLPNVQRFIMHVHSYCFAH